MNIADFRKQYPQYDSLSDTQLADKLHSKYYSNLDKDDFYSKFGVKVQPTENTSTGFSGIGRDILSRAKQAPAAAWQFAKSLPSEISGAAQQLLPLAQEANPLLRAGQSAQQGQVTDANAARTASVIGGGALNLGENALTAPNAFAQYLQDKFPSKSPDMDKRYQDLLSPNVSNIDFQKAMGVKDQKPGDVLLGSLGFAAAPELAETKGMSTFQRALAKSGEGAVYGGLSAHDPITGAILSGGGALGAESPKNIAYSVKTGIPSKILSGSATPEEMAANLETAKGLPVNIGKVTESPFANALYENVISEIPFSGSEKSYKSINQGVQDYADNMLKEMSGGDINLEGNEKTKDLIIKAHENAKDVKNNLYNQVNQTAENEGHSIDLSSTKDKASQFKSQLEDSPLLKFDPSVKSFLDKATSISGEGFSPSIKEANLIKNKLWDQGQSLSSFGNSASERGVGNLYKDLSRNIGNDIKDSIKKTGSPELNQQYEDATNFYKNNYAQFHDEDIYKFLDPKKSNDNIARAIIKPSKSNDQYSQIDKIKSLLSPEDQKSLSHAYLSTAYDHNGNLNIQDLNKLTNSLGRRQFNSLFDQEDAAKINKFQNLMDMSQESRSMMKNPPTGKRAIKSLLGIGAASLAGHAIGGPMAALGAVAGLGATSLGANVLQKYLTNPKVRENLVNAMIKGKPEYKQNAIQKGTQKLLRAAPYANNQQKDSE